MNKIAVITALSGTREKLHDPIHVFPDVDYFAFVDHPQDTKVWKQLPLLNFTIDEKFRNRRNAKIYKVMPHLFFPDHSYHIWHDVSHELIMNPYEVIDKFMPNSDIGLFKHTARNCLYKEALELKNLGYDIDENIDRHIEFCKKENVPTELGLWELPVSIRKNTETIQRMNMMWFEIISRFSSRDQISLPYCLWKLGIEPAILPGYANGFNADGSVGRNIILPQVRSHVSSGNG